MTLPGSIAFDFNFEKFLNLVTYLASKVPGFDVLKAVKLIYLIDRYHLVKNGRLITGDDYYRIDMGPVPSMSYDCLKLVDNDNPAGDTNLPDIMKLRENLQLDKTVKYPIFKNKVDPDLEYFSISEKESIDNIISQYGSTDSISLMNLTHTHRAHLKTPNRSKIDLKLFFEDDPDASQDAFELMQREQEDRDFASGLSDYGYTF